MLLFSIYASNISINIETFKILKEIANPLATQIFGYVNSSFVVVLPLLVLYMYLKKDKDVYSFVIAGISLYVVSDLLKAFFKEPRPCNVESLSWINHISCESSYSFPSNHATVLSGLSLFLGKYKYIRIFYVAWLFTVLFGKLYVGAHYITDIIAGFAISIAIAYFIFENRKKINEAVNNIVKRLFYKLSIK
ncbi:MAG: phosphatase PAP2 family protein [Candidatus Micrarchaeia archaeon]